MKNKIIEICELGQPQSIIHRENEPITELIKTDSLIEELNKQLTIPVVSDTLILTPNDAELFFNEIMNPKEANEALKKAMLKFITR